MSLISRDLEGETREAIPFGIRSIRVSGTKMEVGRDVCQSQTVTLACVTAVASRALYRR